MTQHMEAEGLDFLQFTFRRAPPSLSSTSSKLCLQRHPQACWWDTLYVGICLPLTYRYASVCCANVAIPLPRSVAITTHGVTVRVRRWVNCLLLREVPFPLAVRLWDTYVAEGGRMKEFLTYVLAAFLLCWAPQLRAMDFQARWTAYDV